MGDTSGRETMGFQTEVRQLLQLMIHSLYSNKEIFLRELISNASDACDKLRFEALSDETLYQADSELKIRITVDADKRTITVTDNGIGMSAEEVIDNIGTIAKSGTQQFFEALTGDQRKQLVRSLDAWRRWGSMNDRSDVQQQAINGLAAIGVRGQRRWRR